MLHSLSLSLPPLIDDYLQWWVAGVIVVVGLFGYGVKDVSRLSFTRIWAIAGVCFAESIRRRVLWITPLAILGVFVVSAFSRPVDPLDDIRQTTKFAMFASALVVTICLIILACTNLPKEIDNRVIFTVVTKPTTRLEIVLGKILGFARVSLAILLIMGLFTAGYLAYQSWRLQGKISDQLANVQSESLRRGALEHYQKTGLLFARSFSAPTSMSFYDKLPATDASVRYFSGESEQELLVPFALDDQTRALLTEMAVEPEPRKFQFGIVLRTGYQPRGQTATAFPTTQPDAAPAKPQVMVNFFGADRFTLLEAKMVNGGKPVELADPDGNVPVLVPVAPEALAKIAEQPLVYVQVIGSTQGFRYSVAKEVAKLVVVLSDGSLVREIPISGEIAFRGRQGSMGGQLKGVAENVDGPVAIYSFRGTVPTLIQEGNVPFELRLGIERGAVDVTEDDQQTRMSLVVRNAQTGETSPPAYVEPENNRTAFFSLPASSFQTGDFDVILRCITPEHWVTLGDPITRAASLVLVSSSEPFLWNLVKGLGVMWLMSVLVIVVSIFCSTWLSWPIAIMLTLLILLGRWGVEQLGEDALSAGIGRQVVTDLGLKGGAESKAVSESVEALAKGAKYLAAVLPDITRFQSTELLERGLIVPWYVIRQSLGVLASFALPLMVLAYVILRNKEVAP